MKKNECKTIIVLGVARSGTSATSGVLNILGIDMGKDKYEMFINPRGAFEDNDFRHLINNKIVKAAKKRKRFNPYDYYVDPPTQTQINRVIGRFNNDLETLINKRSEKCTYWGWKSPASHYIVDHVLNYTKNPHFVVVLRNPHETCLSVIKSFKSSKRFSKKVVSRSIIFHTELIFRLISRHPSVPVFFVTYESLVNEPIKMSKSLARFLDIEISQQRLNEINKFIIPRNQIKLRKILKMFDIHFSIIVRKYANHISLISKNYKDLKIVRKEFRNISEFNKSKIKAFKNYFLHFFS